MHPQSPVLLTKAPGIAVVTLPGERGGGAEASEVPRLAREGAGFRVQGLGVWAS